MAPLTGGMLLALLSALSTAFAHALLKSGDDKLAVQAGIRLTGMAIALPLAIWVGLPPPSLWPWLIAATVAHALYQLVVIWSYSVNDFSAAYPIARGTAPVFTTLFGGALLGDQLGAMAVFGSLLVGTGLLSLARGNAIGRNGMVAACLAGLGTTVYSLVDAQGVRLAPSAILFIAWFYLLDGFSMPLLHFLRARGRAMALLRANARTGIAAGILSFMAFAPAIAAFRFAPVATVASLRETSIAIGLVLSHTMLKEALDWKRITGALLILAGALAIIAPASQ